MFSSRGVPKSTSRSKAPHEFFRQNGEFCDSNYLAYPVLLNETYAAAAFAVVERDQESPSLLAPSFKELARGHPWASLSRSVGLGTYLVNKMRVGRGKTAPSMRYVWMMDHQRSRIVPVMGTENSGKSGSLVRMRMLPVNGPTVSFSGMSSMEA